MKRDFLGKRDTVKISVLVMISFLMGPRIFPQDTTGTVVILSPKVGTEVDLAERNKLRLFLGIRDFLSAGLFQRPDSSYVFRVTSQKGGVRSVSVRWLESTKQEIDSIRHIIDDYPQMPAVTAGQSDANGVMVKSVNDTMETALRESQSMDTKHENQPYHFRPRLVGFRFGYRKYMYKTYEIAYEGHSLFEKRPHDNFLLSVFGIWPIGRGVVLMPSIEWWQTAGRPGYVLNADLVYHPFLDRKFHKYIGLGLGLQRVAETYVGGYGSSDARQLRLNIFSGCHIEITEQLWISFEARYLGEPIICQTGISYHPGKIILDRKDKSAARIFFYSIFYIGLVISTLGFVIGSMMPYS